MTFASTYTLDDASPRPPSPLVANHVASAGTYGGGLLSVLDEVSSNSILQCWRWLLGDDATALVASALGDLFFWSQKHGSVYFLEVQRGKSTFVDRQVDYLLNDFLVQAGVRGHVLQGSLFDSLVMQKERLQYGQCYIAEPWLRLGGSGEADTYTKGDLLIYTGMVGQSVQESMSSERSGPR